MSEDHLISISHKLGELTGKLDQALDNQNMVNIKTNQLLEKFGDQIGEVKADKNKIIGAALAISLFGSGVMASVMKFFNGGHP